MTTGADLEAWCWQNQRRPLSNNELFSLARDLRQQQELSREKLEQAVQEALGPNEPSPQADRQLEEDAEHALQKALSGSSAQGEPSPKQTPSKDSPAEAGSSSAFTDVARQLAKAAGDESADAAEAETVATLAELETFLARLEKRTPAAGHGPDHAGGSDAEPDNALFFEHDGQPGGTRPDGAPGALISQALDGFFEPGDTFPRSTDQPPDQELFSGMDHQEDGPGLQQHEQNPARQEHRSGLPAAVRRILAEYHRNRRKAGRHADRLLNQEDLAAALEQLLQLSLVSPTLKDTFLINRDAAAWLLAKKAYLGLDALMRRRPFKRGTHASGSRGVQTVQPDRVQPAQRLSSRISVSHTLRRSLRRRALSPYAPLLDDDDLIEYATRSRIGCSVVLALDISGAVQFGRRIQGVRKACMAFAYYIRRFHPADRVRFVAYHEASRPVAFADVARLRAVNGAGKNIGLCLDHCRSLLKKDPDRLPVVILIGDGLPARGDRAGFYRFQENNKDYTSHAIHAARLLRQDKIFFSFYQFRDERYLWRDLADEMAGRITAKAGGSLYRIENPDTMALSLMTSYERIRTAAVE